MNEQNIILLTGYTTLLALFFGYAIYMIVKNETDKHYSHDDIHNYVKLKRLALHLRHGKLNPPNFSSHIVYDRSEKRGNALAQMPNLCNKWSWHPISGMPRLKRWQIGRIEIYFLNKETAAKHYFGLTQDEYLHLFWGGYQNTKKYGGQMLKNEATVYDHAHNIEQFLSIKYIGMQVPEFV